MKKLLTIAALSITLTIGTGMTTAHAEERGLGYVCNDWHANVSPDMPPAVVHNRVLWLIRCATDRWNVPGGYAQMVAIATRESGPYTWPWAANPSGSSGVFQIIGSTYASWRAAFADRVRMARLVDNVFDARTNVLLAVWAANAYGLGAWGG